MYTQGTDFVIIPVSVTYDQAYELHYPIPLRRH